MTHAANSAGPRATMFDFPQVPYLTENILGPFDYALAYAIALHAARKALQTLFDVEDDDL